MVSLPTAFSLSYQTEIYDEAAEKEQYQLEEIDLNVYEEDDDETLHRKLVASKIARKRAEEDMKLLNNRIGLLKNEEAKVRFNCYFNASGLEKD